MTGKRHADADLELRPAELDRAAPGPASDGAGVVVEWNLNPGRGRRNFGSGADLGDGEIEDKGRVK